jgi:hypothetical protein
MKQVPIGQVKFNTAASVVLEVVGKPSRNVEVLAGDTITFTVPKKLIKLKEVFRFSNA